MGIINFDKNSGSSPSEKIIEQILTSDYQSKSIQTNISATTPRVWQSLTDVTSMFIPLDRGDYFIKAQNNPTIYALLTSDNHVTGTTPDFLQGYQDRYTLQEYQSVGLKNIPDNTYLCVRTDIANVSIPLVFKVTSVETKIPIDLSQYTEQLCSLGTNSGYYTGSQKHIAVPVNPGEKFLIKANSYSLPGNQVGYFVFVTSNYNPPYSSNDSVPVVSESPTRLIAQKQLLISAEAPSDAAYLILTMVDGGNGRTDGSLGKYV